ncbi:survival motor neuron interacting protein 1-domain-containing protein [Dissophora ornata]|nr:survival motor neuron interacting protein 1-domain-containing protein [Dissophora ornata]
MDEMLPSSGEEYLRMVKAQARSCPAVVIAPKAEQYLSVKNTSRKYRTDWNSCRPAPEGCAPSTEWKEHFMNEFGVARSNLKRHQQQPPQGPTAKRRKSRREEVSTVSNNSSEQDQQYPTPDLGSSNESASLSSPSKTAPASSISSSAHIDIPNMFDEQGWRALLYGPGAGAGSTTRPAVPVVVASSTANEREAIATTTTTNTPQEVTSVTSASTSILDSTTLPATATAITISQGILPQPQFLVRLNQGHLIQLLKYHLRWMAEDDVTEHQGKWLYALFLKLDPLVESDQVSILRSLAKKCSRIRSHLHSDSGSKLATVNMVITIVAQLFGQSDLE